MCLDYKDNKEKREKWLEKQPDVITAYKVVRVKKVRNIFLRSKEKLIPLYYGSKPFKRKNRLSKNPLKSEKTTFGSEKYITYYHLFLEEKEARRYSAHSIEVSKLIECKIPKEFITDMGTDAGYLTVVTKGFDIVGQDEYLN